MIGRRIVRWMLASFMLVCLAALAQQAPQSDSQLPDAPQQQPQAQPPPPPPADEAPKPETKPESKIKKTLKRGAPNCIQIIGMEKCKESKDDQEDTEEQKAQQPRVPSNQPLPRSTNPEESSSKDSPVDLPPPAGEAAPSDVQELHPYNPHKADKDVEVGDFYFKRGNLRAAESRYAEALNYMPNHAEATFKLAETQDKLGKKAQAQENYRKYLKILPEGEFAAQAKKALARLRAATSPPAEKPR